jgi:hypothetical protein
MLNFDQNIRPEFQKSMEILCLELLHQGYEAMFLGKGYDVDWKEDKLTVHYIAHMKELEICKEGQISIIPQFVIYSDEHAFGDEEVEKAPRIDFKFIKWFQRFEIDFFAEAKNLSAKSWKKKNGANVDSNYYYNRYIETGISHLISGYYPNTCFLIAYVLNGNRNNIISNLNNRIIRDFPENGYGQIIKLTPSVHEEYYISDNTFNGNNIIVKHLFLQLA